MFITRLNALLLFVLWAISAVGGDDQHPFGIERRIPWTTSRITGSPQPPAPYRLRPRFPRLSFKNPVVLTSAPGSSRLFLVELDGKIYSFENDDQCVAPDLFCDLKGAVARLDQVYGLAFHPNFDRLRYCYICYRIGSDIPDGTRVSRFEVRPTNPPTVDVATEKVVITWRSGGHNGGCLEFGPDGCLYISTGDGGPAFPPDPLNSGQDLATLLSAVLRIDVDHDEGGRGYSVPADNPFVNLAGARGEIWAYGLRNPWKISFDRVTGDLWAGDVGWELWEMVYRIDRGANYGWSLVEGPQPVHRERQRGPTPIVPPTVVHSHTEARSITGGHVYRGQRLPELAGRYVYGDYVTGKIWALPVVARGGATPPPRELVDTALPIICFGVDRQQELYVISYEGTIHELVKNPPVAANAAFPARLSETGLFVSTAEHRVAPGVVPYRIKAEPWMDEALAERFVALPGETSLGVFGSSNAQIGYLKGMWSFPTDAVLMKTISLELEPGKLSSRRRLETQILHYDVDTWRAYDFVWNDEQSDAVLADDRSSERTFTIRDPTAPGAGRQQTWRFPSRTECLLCHTTRGGSIYGFNPPQLDRDHDYGAVTDNQLRTLQHIGLFRQLASEPSSPLVDPYDASADIAARARAYLHINCAHCHRRGGGGTAAMDVQYQLPLSKTSLLGERPTQGTFGIHGAQVLAPGDPFGSVLLYRMAKLGRGRMPYLGSVVVDQRGLQLMREWIAALGAQEAAGRGAAARSILLRERVERLRRQSPSPAQPAISELLDTPSGALALLFGVVGDELPAAIRQEAIDLGKAHPDIQVRDLYERFIPEELRARRLGGSTDTAAVLNLVGDAERGRQLFFANSGGACKNCHQVSGQGTAVGPELTQIGRKYDRVQLLESVLDPSKVVEPKFQTYLLETRDGRVINGLLVSRDDRQVVLKDAQAKEIRVAHGDIERLVVEQKSLMPELLLQDLTASQAADLLAYLTALR